MRLLVELLIIAGLIYLGWETPFAQRANEVSGGRFGFGKPASTPQPAVVRATSSPSGAWMNDPNRRTALDTPPPQAVHVQPVATPKPGSWMFDPDHKSPLDPVYKPATPSPR